MNPSPGRESANGAPREDLLVRVARSLRDWLDDFVSRKSEAEVSRSDEAQETLGSASSSEQSPSGRNLQQPGPPEHWLQRVREGAPELLLPPEDGGVPGYVAGGLPASQTTSRWPAQLAPASPKSHEVRQTNETSHDAVQAGKNPLSQKINQGALPTPAAVSPPRKESLPRMLAGKAEALLHRSVDAIREGEENSGAAQRERPVARSSSQTRRPLPIPAASRLEARDAPNPNDSPSASRSARRPEQLRRRTDIPSAPSTQTSNQPHSSRIKPALQPASIESRKKADQSARLPDPIEGEHDRGAGGEAPSARPSPWLPTSSYSSPRDSERYGHSSPPNHSVSLNDGGYARETSDQSSRPTQFAELSFAPSIASRPATASTSGISSSGLSHDLWPELPEPPSPPQPGLDQLLRQLERSRRIGSEQRGEL